VEGDLPATAGFVGDEEGVLPRRGRAEFAFESGPRAEHTSGTQAESQDAPQSPGVYGVQVERVDPQQDEAGAVRELADILPGGTLRVHRRGVEGAAAVEEGGRGRGGRGEAEEGGGGGTGGGGDDGGMETSGEGGVLN